MEEDIKNIKENGAYEDQYGSKIEILKPKRKYNIFKWLIGESIILLNNISHVNKRLTNVYNEHKNNIIIGMIIFIIII